MKNLKKVLALGLALVMILGMFTIASAAETKSALDFTDWNEVEHKDAVALCVDLGIINGLPDGSFNPKGTIDRASWAKLVYFTATGDDNADAYLGSAIGMKDIVGNWAESYINYLVANKYVAGDGQGNYLPTGTVTVAAGLKTMLTVLGYDADDRGYQNDAAWMGNVMTDAKRNGLMDDVDRAQTAAVNLTRENAAQIVYNALQANTVESESRRDQGQSYVVSYTKGPTLGYDVFSILKVTGTVKSIDKDGNATFAALTFDNGASCPVTAISGKVKASAAVVGEEAAVFVKCSGARFAEQTGELSGTPTVKEPASSSVAKAASNATATFTNGVTVTDLWDSEKDDYVAAAPKENTGTEDAPVMVAAPKNIDWYLNGVSSNQTAVAAAAAKRGNVLDVYAKEGTIVTIKCISYTAAKLSGDVETRTSSGKLQVKVPGVGTLNAWTDAEKVDGYQGLVEDDVVLYYAGPNSTWVIEKAEKVNGKVTEREAGGKDLTDAAEKAKTKLTINNTQYQQSQITGAEDIFYKWDVKAEADNEYDFFLDKNGTVVLSVLVEGETNTEVAYVIETAWVNGGGGLSVSQYLEAEMLFTDGTTQIVKIGNIGDDKAAESDAPVAGDNAKPGTLDKKFVDFSVNSKGNYDVTVKGTKLELVTSKVEVEEEEVQRYVIKNAAIFNTDGSTNNVADDKTVFLVKKGTGDDAEYFVYTGKLNVPKMNATAAVAIESKGTATYVYLETTSYDGETPDGYIYIKDAAGYRVNASGLYVYNIVDANGAETTMALKSVVEKAGFYSVTAVNAEDGNVVKEVACEDALEKIGNGNVTIGGKTYSYDKTTVCVIIDLNEKDEYESAGTFSPDTFTIEGPETYTYKAVRDAGTDELLSFLYVIRDVTPATTSTGA